MVIVYFFSILLIICFCRSFLLRISRIKCSIVSVLPSQNKQVVSTYIFLFLRLSLVGGASMQHRHTKILTFLGTRARHNAFHKNFTSRIIIEPLGSLPLTSPHALARWYALLLVNFSFSAAFQIKVSSVWNKLRGIRLIKLWPRQKICL